MTTDDFKLIEIAFARALTLEGGDREAFILEFEKTHPALGEKLRQLLQADAEPDDGISDPVGASVKALAKETADPWTGKQVGVWKIISRIGVGGMGAVFLAERTDEEYSQTAALKIMGAQLLNANATARFRAERQILANLNHPNIATLIDGGTLDTDLPYLVMEYVDGVRIDKFCDDQNFSIQQRLQLFLKVCDAVDYAHRNLVVHRDLKPSNILVPQNAEPKLLDFGIAKLLEPGAAPPDVTREGARVLTPEYASPEQVRGEAVSVATDIYSLGVLLFRLLTGHSPYGPSITTPRDMESAILEKSPQRPSSIVTQSDESASAGITSAPDATGGKRAASTERLRRSLAGDLDNIVLKCLQKEPDRRYATVRDLAADLNRYLTNRPVTARGDDWAYKARKFIKRNSQPLLAAFAVLVGLVALTAYYTNRLAGERDRAALAATKAIIVSDFLTDVFRSADPHTAQGEDITALELLRQAEHKLDSLDNDPALKGEMMQIIGDTYRSLGDIGRGLTLLEQSLALQDSALPQKSLARANLLQDLREAYRENEILPEAEQAALRELAILDSELPKGHPRIAYGYARLALILSDQRRKPEALAMLRKAVETKLAGNPEPDAAYVDMIGNMAHMLTDLGEIEEAKRVHAETLRLSTSIDGDMHPNTLIRRSNYARLLSKLWRFEEAEQIYGKIIEKAYVVWSPGHVMTARWVGNRAVILGKLGRFEEARRDHEKAIAATLAADGETSARSIARVRLLGETLIDMGELEEAEQFVRRAYDIAMRQYDRQGYEVAMAQIQLSRLENIVGAPAEAEILLRQAMDESAHLSADPYASAAAELAVSLSLQNRHEEAIAMIEDIIGKRSAEFGGEAAPMANFYRVAALVYRRAADLPRAVDYGRRAHETARKGLPAGNWIAALCAAEYAYAVSASGATSEAAEIAATAHRDLLAAFGPDDARVRKVAALLAPQ